MPQNLANNAQSVFGLSTQAGVVDIVLEDVVVDTFEDAVEAPDEGDVV